MEDFIARKKEYYKSIELINGEVFKKFIERANIKIKEVLLDPKDINELVFAESYLQMIKDCQDLVINTCTDNVKPIDLDNSVLVNYFVNLISSISSGNQEDIDRCEEELKHMNAENSAHMLYEIIVLLTNSDMSYAKHIASKSGFNMNNLLDALRFELYLQKASNIINSKDIMNVDTSSRESVEEFKRFIDEFHKLCEENKLDKDTLKLEFEL